jgi:NADPH-dependent glutamate synthase beta subunit-like oxidoreductase
VDQLIADHDFVVVAAGAQKPRTLPIAGKERLVTALDFLAAAKSGHGHVGRRVVIIGAGNVGCDVAAEAARLGADDIVLLDVQQPASFGKEREEAEKVGARFRWPVFHQAVTAEGVLLDSGEVIPADTVVVSIGDAPDLDFLPPTWPWSAAISRWTTRFQTSNPKVFAIGDAVRPGLLTDAIGAGRRAARIIDAILRGKRPPADKRTLIDIERVHLEYYDPRMVQYEDWTSAAASAPPAASAAIAASAWQPARKAPSAGPKPPTAASSTSWRRIAVSDAVFAAGHVPAESGI